MWFLTLLSQGAGSNHIESGNNSNGSWIKFPDGTIIQYGTFAAQGWQTITFPIAFPHKCISLTFSSGVPDSNFNDYSSYTWAPKTCSPSRTGSKYYVNGNFSMWMAIGN